MKKITIVLLIVLISISAFSQSPKKNVERHLGIKKLQWLAGYWTAEVNGTKMEEFWLPESNGIMIGIHRDSFQSGNVFFEYLRILEKDSLLTYYASPLGKKSTEFKLKFLNEKRVIFENLEHDFPQRILYSLKEDTLFVRIEGMVKNELKFSEWKWFKTDLK